MRNLNTSIIAGFILLFCQVAVHAEVIKSANTEAINSIEISSKDKDREGFPDDLIGGGTRLGSSIVTAEH